MDPRIIINHSNTVDREREREINTTTAIAQLSLPVAGDYQLITQAKGTLNLLTNK
jgi:hypothetical protein